MSIGPELKRLGGQVSHLEHQLVQHKNNAERFKAERDELKEKLHLMDAITPARRKRFGQIPRVISAEELKDGIWVARKRPHQNHWRAGQVFWNVGINGWSMSAPRMIGNDELDFLPDDELILLADAPPQESGPVTAEDVCNSNPGATFYSKGGISTYEWTGEKLVVQGDDSGRCILAGVTGKNLWRSTAAPRGDYPKRLSVADLDAAEVGSRLSSGNGFPERVKIEGGGWEQTADGWSCLSSDLIDPRGRTLTPPEPARRGRVVKAEELREGDVVNVWRDGILVRKDVGFSGLVQWRDEEGWGFRLISRKPPQPKDSPILVLGYVGKTPDFKPVHVWDEKSGLWCGYWEVSTGKPSNKWLDPKTTRTEDITDWQPLVPAGQEG